MATLRVVLDTKVLLSGIAYPASVPGKILAAWRQRSIEVFLSAYILEELRRLLPQLSQRHGLNAPEIEDLVDTLAIQAEIVEPVQTQEPELQDDADQPVLNTLLALLKTTGASYLITGDKDLLALSDRYPIVTPAIFWALHAGI